MRYTESYYTKHKDYANFTKYRTGDFVVAVSNDKYAKMKVLKGIVTFKEAYEYSDSRIKVQAIGTDNIYTLNTNLICVHIPTTYPRFNELTMEISTMSSENRQDYENIYNCYKLIDASVYSIGDYVQTASWAKVFDYGIITDIGLNSTKDDLLYTINTIHNGIQYFRSSDIVKSTFADYSNEKEAYDNSSKFKIDEKLQDTSAHIRDLESQIYDLKGVITATNSCISIDSGGYTRLDELEEKQRKTQKLVKLGISLLLGGI